MFVLVLLAVVTSTRAAGVVLLGDQKVESGNDSDAAGRAEAFRATATGTGTLATLSVYVGSPSASTKLVVGLYSSNGSKTHPSTLLAQGSLGAPVKGAWNTVTLTSQPQITSGATYWLTVLSPAGAGSVAFRDVSSSGGVSETSSQSALTALPVSWTSGVVYKDGPLSAFGSATVAPDAVAPTVPTGLGISGATQSTLSLSWAPSSDNVGVAGYDVYRGGVSVGTTTATGFTFAGLSCGTTYSVAVDAFDAAGNVSAPSAVAGSTSACPDTMPPSAPTGLAQSGATESSVSLGWSASSDNVGVVGYGVYVNGVLRSSTAVASATVSGLVCGSSYTFAVDAYDAAGNRSTQASATMATAGCPPDAVAPTVPTGLGISGATQSTLSLSWAPSSDNVGVAGYDVYRGGVSVGTTTATGFTFAGLSCGTTYSVAVDAFDAAGNVSAPSAVAGSTSACPDTTPPSVSVTAPANGTTVSGIAPVSASAADNIGVVGVQFKLDGVNLAAEDTTAPFAIAWDTSTAANGSHVITAVARDVAGNSTVSTPITVTVNNALAQPTVLPAAGANGVTVGPGFARSTEREIVRTAGNVVYVVAADDNLCQNSGGVGVIRAWKGVGAQLGDPNVPTSFVEQDVAHHPTAAQLGQVCIWNPYSMLYAPDVRLDRSGVIHLAYTDPSTGAGNVWYQTFSTVTDTWGPRSLIGAGAAVISGSGWPRTAQLALTLDANDVPHVVWVTSGSSNGLRYTTKAGGSWSAPVTIASGSNLMNPSMTTALDGTIHLVWLENSLAAHATIRYARLAGGVWGAAETVSSGDSNVLANSDNDQSPNITTDTYGVPHVVYLDGTVNGSDNFVRDRYRRGDGTWIDNSPPGGNGGASNPSGGWYAHNPAGYISTGGDEYVFLGHDVNISPAGFQWQTGGPGNPWSLYTLLDPRNKTNTSPGTDALGVDGAASIRFDPLRDNNPAIIDVLYYDESDGTPGYDHHATLYYKAVKLH